MLLVVRTSDDLDANGCEQRDDRGLPAEISFVLKKGDQNSERHGIFFSQLLAKSILRPTGSHEVFQKAPPQTGYQNPNPNPHSEQLSSHRVCLMAHDAASTQGRRSQTVML